MIPLRLQIKNFLSYGSDLQTIDFNHYQLICLSGKNGHGKSALLDAITWAIWGQARKIGGIAKADQGLLRLGQTNMLVILDFQCNRQTYRVRREYSFLYGKPHASLDFGLLEPETEKYVSLTDKTIRETQAKIENTLKLDYDSFINSAFLRQGQSNEFSKKSPKERKEILANILGLNTYEIIRKKAQEKTRTLLLAKNTLASTEEKINQEIQLLLPALDEKAGITKALQETQTSLEKIKITQLHLEQEKTDFQTKKQEQQQVLYQIDLLQSEFQKKKSLWLNLIDLSRTVHRRRKSIKQLEEILIKKQEINSSLINFQLQWQKKLSLSEELLIIKTKCQQLELTLTSQHTNAIDQVKNKIEKNQLEKQLLKKSLQELIAQSTKIEQEKTTLEKQHQQLAHSLEKIQNQNHSFIEHQFEKRKEYYHKWIALGNMTKNNLDAVKHKLLLADNEAPSCPLCEQNLSASRKRFLNKKLSHEEQFIRHRLNRLIKITKKLKDLLYEQHAHYEQIKKDKQAIAVAIAQQAELVKQQEKFQLQIDGNVHTRKNLEACLIELNVQLMESEKEITRLKNSAILENDSIYQALVKEQQNKKNEIELLAYDEQKHATLQAQATELDKQLQLLHEAQKQLSEQQDRKARIHADKIELKQLKYRIQLLQQELPDYEFLVKQEIELHNRFIECEKVLQELHTKKEELRVIQAGLIHKTERLTTLQKELVTVQHKVKEIEQACNDYQAIAQATSKDGIQALLIEDVLPEIEHEANHLLSRLTDNQTQLFIESLRDLKKGGTRETLDIKISDASGLRAYELFSGGEAFRIDFALRIAISKLLARRSGTALQTLIIDEGFGSQDEDGLQHIMEALYAIQEDFAKIIIVSHLPAMKNQFPVHFTVEKNSRGSYVQIIEQD